ncbi:thioesterase [Rhodococcus rhodnii]|uniref:Thioesterase TesA n=2 Tax=Rhodococcus rhodnii TaxID=38312 RepID=R7WPK8_9NOCA|nr:alpha/beta fold hydrolase [Rhodococcus rhodnii]EOM77251.1 thioesterase [Rhodococcus rhodnii LMG 5362]TXG90159.1 thioesterase [Rhodococcus rhodnii]
MTTLLCFHHAGGAGTTFRSWQNDAAGSDLAVVAAQLPATRPLTGRRVHTDTAALVEHLVQTHAAELRGPHVLYGHSMGGLLAYLVARRIGGDPAFAASSALVVAASWSPRMRPSIDVDALTDTELVDLLIEIGGIPADLVARREWLAPMLPLLRDDLRMCGGYRHDPVADRVTVPLHVIGAEGDRLVRREQTDGWAALGTPVTIEYREGGHFFETDPQGLRSRVFEIARAAAEPA